MDEQKFMNAKIMMARRQKQFLEITNDFIAIKLFTIKGCLLDCRKMID